MSKLLSHILLFVSIFIISIDKVSAQSNISGIINTYAPVLNINASLDMLTIGTVAGIGSFNVGDQVLILQMKGASIDDSESPTYGQITAYNDVGNYEFTTIASVSGSNLSLSSPLTKSFTVNESVQVIRIPRYSSGATVLPAGLTGLAWDGSLGGVLAIKVNSSLTLNGNISMNGMGFRGGSISSPAGDCSITTYRTTNTQLGYKGEGIATEPNSNLNGRGALANGGGGGNGHNAGGGGGGLAGEGNTGGRQWAGNFISGWCGVQDGTCNDPNNTVGGIGGKSLDVSLGRYFLGGGGGGGQQDNNVSSDGGNGGGMVIIFADQIVGNGFTISANGNSALNASWDGAGGGGSGGTIIIECNNFSGNLLVNAQGGNGGNTSGCHGPGGGGGGGLIQFTANITAFPNVSYGANAGNNGSQPAGETCGDPAVSVGDSFCGVTSTQSSGIVANQASSLPVNLVYFKGQAYQDYNLLLWQTNLEENNAFFVLERSQDGRNFVEIGRIDGAGNHIGIKNYSFKDDSPFVGFNYYRLKQVDTDSSSHTSLVILLKNTFKKQVSIYPNPTKDGLVYISNLQPLIHQCELIDSMGQIVWMDTITDTAFKIDMSYLPQGVYILVIKNAQEKLQKKILKK
jgi:Secretion system C-terminal sorting domain